MVPFRCYIFPEMKLTSCQNAAMNLLKGTDNVFLTGQAGTGKSFLIERFRRETTLRYPVLASTGAAAVIVGGRTFHSYFGLGILEGGPAATINKAIRNSKVRKRLNAADGIILDEVSMIPGVALATAEAIARHVRDRDVPWGGLRVIAVGDFYQLPPISRDRTAERDWAFKSPIWQASQFIPSILDTVMRTSDPDFLEVLNRVRVGQCDALVTDFLNSRDIVPPEDMDLTRLFPFRETTELHNLERLGALKGKEVSFPTIYTGPDNFVAMLRNSAPIPQALRIKPDALVMLRHNDPKGRWVNGSTGYVRKISTSVLHIELLDGFTIELEPLSFEMLDADGKRVASATNFPITLAYAATIHKAQGATLTRMHVDLKNLWEPGQAYVALSRVRRGGDMFINGWNPRSIRTDSAVTRFEQALRNQ